jgi:hypothetical protein
VPQAAGDEAGQLAGSRPQWQAGITHQRRMIDSERGAKEKTGIERRAFDPRRGEKLACPALRFAARELRREQGPGIAIGFTHRFAREGGGGQKPPRGAGKAGSYEFAAAFVKIRVNLAENCGASAGFSPSITRASSSSSQTISSKALLSAASAWAARAVIRG